MVVFRIDLMNSWIDRLGSDRCDVDGVILLVGEITEEGLLRYDGADTSSD